MAAPFIAGLLGAGAALYDNTGSYPDITPAQLINILYGTASAGNFGQRPIQNNRLVNVNAFFEQIIICRDETINDGECNSVKEDYPSEIKTTSVGSDFGGCSLASKDKTGLPNLIIFMAIPLLIALRRKLTGRSPHQ
jgi:hypothetical protein